MDMMVTVIILHEAQSHLCAVELNHLRYEVVYDTTQPAA
jgi:hypothetical protein